MLALVRTVADWSRCPVNRRHGCVLAVDGRYIVATGYNGTARGESHCNCEDKDKSWCESNCNAAHAEINAICNAARVGAPVERCVAYLTKAPCRPCRAALKNAGVAMVVWLQGNVETGAIDEDFEVFHKRLETR
jgi:deoxycytidylate deaminase